MRTVATESIEMEDMSEESDNAEEDIEDAKEHCPYCNPFLHGELFLASMAVRTVPAEEFIISHVPPVESPPPRL